MTAEAGYNLVVGSSGSTVAADSNEYVFVYDVSGATPIKSQVLQVPNTFTGVAWNPSGAEFYVSGGVDDNDSVSVIDTATRQVIDNIPTTAPESLFANPSGLRGANPDSLALSPDERTLYVANGGTNSIAVIHLEIEDGERRQASQQSQVVGLIPTGWYPNSVSVSRDGRQLFVVNGKSIPGPDPAACRNTLSTADADLVQCADKNQYVWQLEKGSFLMLPVPNELELSGLSAQVAVNNHFPGFDGGTAADVRAQDVMREVASRIRYVIYIIKENRTYDQVLGDLPRGDGEPSLTLFPQPLTPNHHALATQFVTLDHFYDSGETSGVGWNWTVAGRTTDSIEKTQPPNYADRGLTYDWEGTNRNINVGLATLAERLAADPYNPDDPDVLPGTADVASHVTSEGNTAGYLWDAALDKGLSVRNYGCFGDLARYNIPSTWPGIPLTARLRPTESCNSSPPRKRC